MRPARTRAPRGAELQKRQREPGRPSMQNTHAPAQYWQGPARIAQKQIPVLLRNQVGAGCVNLPAVEYAQRFLSRSITANRIPPGRKMLQAAKCIGQNNK